jgi:ribosome-associated translation inhibitor RaiA
MQTPLEITFQGVEKSDAIENKIIEKFNKLERHFDRIVHGRVVIASAHRSAHKGKTYQIKIEIGIPDRAPIVVTHEPEVAHPQSDLLTGLREAFETAQRCLDNTSARLSAGAKAERGRRRPASPGLSETQSENE